MTRKHLNLTVAFALLSLMAKAQQATAAKPLTQSEFESYTLYFMITSVVIVLLIGFLVMLYHNSHLIKIIYGLKDPVRAEEEKAAAGDKINEPGFWDKLYQTFIMPRRKRDEDLMMDHNYDGIKELDNSMPPWLKYVFFVTIFVAIVYLLRYHVYTDWSSKKEYDDEVAAANVQKTETLASQKNTVDETSIVQLTDGKSLAAGKALYMGRCVACHGASGEGLVGPNLTDEFWIHGCSMAEVFKTIKYGVPAKGMLTWNGVLNPDELAQVSSYVMTLRGTNPPNPKAPQGDKCTPAASGSEASATTADTSVKVKETKSKPASPGK